MIENITAQETPEYASGAESAYLTPPSEDQINRGVRPLNALPASWWNYMWCTTNGSLNKLITNNINMLGEMQSVLTAAGMAASSDAPGQLATAIAKIHQGVGTAITAGSVRSSTDGGNVSISTEGIMTANGVGNAAFVNLAPLDNRSTCVNYSDITQAITGTRAEVACRFTTERSEITNCINTRAPTSHASTATTYGVGNATNFGHVKVSDVYDTLQSGEGIAASQKALHCIYEKVRTSMTCYSNNEPKPLGEANAGTLNAAARADHVHPLPTCVECSGHADFACCADLIFSKDYCNCYTGWHDRNNTGICGCVKITEPGIAFVEDYGCWCFSRRCPGGGWYAPDGCGGFLSGSVCVVKTVPSCIFPANISCCRCCGSICLARSPVITFIKACSN